MWADTHLAVAWQPREKSCSKLQVPGQHLDHLQAWHVQHTVPGCLWLDALNPANTYEL